MKVGDKVIHIFDPYASKNYPLDNIIVARITRFPSINVYKTITIKPIKNLIGSKIYKQLTNSKYLHELGDYKVIKMIFERGINLD